MSATFSASDALPTDDSGQGGPGVLLIPGWCGDRTVFDDVRARLSRTRRAVSVDLPGHGESPDTGDYRSADVVDALIATLEAAGLDQVVPVCLSHAGWLGIELRRKLGAERVPGLVLLDWMVLGTPPGFADALEGLQSPAWQDVRSALMSMWGVDFDVPELTAYVESMGTYGEAHWNRAGREISAGFAAQPVPLAAIEQLQPCPTLHLYAQPAAPEVLQAQQEYAADHPWFRVGRLDAQSHFPMFEVPDALVTAIDAFIAEISE